MAIKKYKVFVFLNVLIESQSFAGGTRDGSLGQNVAKLVPNRTNLRLKKIKLKTSKVSHHK